MPTSPTQHLPPPPGPTGAPTAGRLTAPDFHAVPSFSQLWSQLPADGVYYCLPASALDWLAYMQWLSLAGLSVQALWNNAFPQLVAGPDGTPMMADPTQVSTFLRSLGEAVGTSSGDTGEFGPSGTPPDEFAFGLQGWMERNLGSGSLPYQVTGLTYEPGFAISYEDIFAWLQNGQRTILQLDMYDETDEEGVYTPSWNSHCVALTSFAQSSDLQSYLGTICNPLQIPDSTGLVPGGQGTCRITWDFETEPGATPMLQLHGLQGIRVISGIFSISDMQAAGVHCNGAGDCSDIGWTTAFTSADDPPEEASFPTGDLGGDIADMAPDPNRRGAIAFVREDSTAVFLADAGTRRSTTLLTLPRKPRRILYGGVRPYLYAAAGDELYVIDTRSPNPRILHTARLDFEADALALDAKRNRLVLTESSGEHLFHFDLSRAPHLPEPVRVALPASIEGGRATLSVGPDSVVHLHRDGAGQLLSFHIDEPKGSDGKRDRDRDDDSCGPEGRGVTVDTVPLHRPLKSAQVDASGRLFAIEPASGGARHGRVVELDREGNKLKHQLFGHLSVDHHLVLSRPHCNVDSRLLDPRRWRQGPMPGKPRRPHCPR